jgi:hypothetical protein
MVPLMGAADGAREMAGWAKAQGLVPEHIKLLTDSGDNSVTISDVKLAVREMLDTSDEFEQLIVYFAGHGFDGGYGEQWLLSDAPDDPNAAINVLGSVALAQRGGTPHVVLISDACRTSAAGGQQQHVRGGEIFPNPATWRHARSVDQFFATLSGRAAVEVKVAAGRYRALYTTAVLSGLSEQGPADRDGFIRPCPLRDYLELEVPRLIGELPPELAFELEQEPDAIITSGHDAWISQVRRPSRVKAPRPLRGRRLAPRRPAGLSVGPAGQLLSEDPERALAECFGESFELLSRPVTEPDQESLCWFEPHGGELIDVFSPGVEAHLDPHRGVVRIVSPPPPGASVLMRFADGANVCLPALPEYGASLIFDGGELVDVAYEPAPRSVRALATARMIASVRRVRAIASASTRSGRFKLDVENPEGILQMMRECKLVDPALAVYAAYAYQELGRIDLIAEMGRYLTAGLGANLFDLDLFAGASDDSHPGSEGPVLGFMPLLAQGWALLRAYDVDLPPALEGVREHVRASVWTLLDETGGEIVRHAMLAGEVT